MNPDIAQTRNQVAPAGKLRIGLNYSNFLLVLKDAPDGTPRGIAPDLGRELGRRLGLEVEWTKFDGAGKLADAVKDAKVDVGFLGAEPQRANDIAFTDAYLEIPVTFLVPAGSPIQTIGDIDRKGVRVSVSARSAYDLYLSRTLKNAELHRAEGIQASYDLFVEKKLDALGGLKPRLVTDHESLPGSRILDGQITGVQQAIGVPKAREKAAGYMREFAADIRKSGLVQKIIDQNGVRGVTAGK